MLLLPMKDFSLKQSGVENASSGAWISALWSWKSIGGRRTVSSSRCARASLFPELNFSCLIFAGTLVPVFSYLPGETLIWLDGADRVEAEAERFGQLAWERHEQAEEEHRLVAPVERFI